jgi:ATP-dependent Lon protease
MRMPGKGTVQLTGQMGDVMKESAAAAFTYVRARARSFGLDPDFLAKIDVHVHLPQGAVPKDGPSAGIAILVSLASMLTGRKVLSEFAMTGEITLRGNVLRVGGIKDKCLAAHRAGVKHVILPKLNEPDLEEVPKEIREALQFHLVTRVDEALALALEPRAVLAESAAAPPT